MYSKVLYNKGALYYSWPSFWHRYAKMGFGPNPNRVVNHLLAFQICEVTMNSIIFFLPTQFSRVLNFFHTFLRKIFQYLLSIKVVHNNTMRYNTILFFNTNEVRCAFAHHRRIPGSHCGRYLLRPIDRRNRWGGFFCLLRFRWGRPSCASTAPSAASRSSVNPAQGDNPFFFSNPIQSNCLIRVLFSKNPEWI